MDVLWEAVFFRVFPSETVLLSKVSAHTSTHATCNMPDYKTLEIQLKMLDNVHSTSIYIVLRIITVPILAMEKNVFKENNFLNINIRSRTRSQRRKNTSHPRTGSDMPLCRWANRSRCKDSLSQPSLHTQGRVSVTMGLNRATSVTKQLLLGWEKTASPAASGHPGMLHSAVFSTLFINGCCGRFTQGKPLALQQSLVLRTMLLS